MHWLLLSFALIDALCLIAGLQTHRPYLALLGWLGHLTLLMAGTYHLVRLTRASRRAYWAWLCLLLFLPVIGWLLAWVFLQNNTWFRPSVCISQDTTRADSYIELTANPSTSFSPDRLSQRLSALTTDDYLDLLGTTQHLPNKPAKALLDDALHSSTESARLLAQALSSKQEQRQMQQLKTLTEQLKNQQMRNPNLHLALAQLHWQIFESRRLDSFQQTETLQKVRLHANFAAQLNPNLAQAHWLTAQVNLHQHHYQAAEHALKRAANTGIHLNRIKPYLQAIRFQQNRPTNRLPSLKESA